MERNRASIDTADALPSDDSAKYISVSGALMRLPLPRHRRLAVAPGALAVPALEVLVRHRMPRLALRAMLRLPFWENVTPIPELDHIAKQLDMNVIGALQDSKERHDPKVIGLVAPADISQGQSGFLIVKLAWGIGAIKKVRTEASCLKDLTRIGTLGGRVPRLVAAGAVGSAQFLVQSSFPRGSRPCGSKFSVGAEDVLRCLAGYGRGTYCNSIGYRRLEPLREASNSDLWGSLGRDLTWPSLEAVLQKSSIPSTYVHRDFVPGNCVMVGQNLFVYDWENAIASGNPLQDFFNWHTHPNLRLPRIFETQWISKLLEAARKFAQRIYPNYDWNRHLVLALFIAYLLDQIVERRGRTTSIRCVEQDLYLQLLRRATTYWANSSITKRDT